MSALFPDATTGWLPREAWEAFVSMRKSKGKRNPWTPLSEQRALQALAEWHQQGVDIAEVLLICAEYGWVGVQWGKNELDKRSRMAGARPPQESAQLRALRALDLSRRGAQR